MAQRRIGQERLGIGEPSRGPSSLDALSELIDCQPIAALLVPFYPETKREPGWLPLAMVKALLLATWHDLSDVKLAEALDDRASFRRFCGFARHEATPERTAFVRFRRLVVARRLDGALFDAVTAQLKAKAITVKTSTLVDATIIASASTGDEDGRWVKHKGRPTTHGFKAHVGADASTALVEKISVTPANVNDGRAGDAAVPEEPGDVCADSAYRGPHFHAAVLARGGTPRVILTALWGCDEQETLARLDAWNRPIRRIRGRIEKIFGTWKRSCGLRRMRWRGLAKATAQVHFTTIADNLKRALNILAAAA